MNDNNLGLKIRTLRLKSGLTQKDLAEKLFVTPQAISRWENDGIEPPIESLKTIAALSNVSLDNLLCASLDELLESIEEEKKIEPIQEEKAENNAPTNVFYGICDECHNPFKGPEDIHDKVITKRIRHGKHHRTTTSTVKICGSCAEKHKKEEEHAAKQKHIEDKNKAHNNRLRAVWLSPLCAAAFTGLVSLIILIFCNQLPAYKENPMSFYLVPLIISFILTIPMFACIFLNNNVVTYIVASVLLKFTFKAPMVIFALDWDGLAFLIVVKVILAILAVLLGILGTLVAAVIGSIISLFVLPLAIKRSYDKPSDTMHVL